MTAETYFTEEGRLAFRREWSLKDRATGKVMGVATSTWVTINMATRRLIKVPEELRSKFTRFGPPATV